MAVGVRYPTGSQQGPGAGTSLLRRSHQSFPGIEPGNDWSRVQPENALAGLELSAPT